MKVKQRAKNISMLTQRIEIIDGITVYDLISLGDYVYWEIGENKNDEKLNQIAKLLQYVLKRFTIFLRPAFRISI